MAIDLFKYLPRYYLDSRIMKALQDSIGEEVPDAIGYLWRVLFCNTVPDEGLWLWLDEYDALTRDEVYAKMRGGGALNLEMLLALSIGAVETTFLCPEVGINLSEDDAFFVDGIYYGPLISEIWVDTDELEVAKRLVALTGMAGFRYWMVLKCQNTVPKSPAVPYVSLSEIPPLCLPEPWDFDILSGGILLAMSQMRSDAASKSFANRAKVSIFSPLAFWVEELYWNSETSFMAQSCTTQMS